MRHLVIIAPERCAVLGSTQPETLRPCRGTFADETRMKGLNCEIMIFATLSELEVLLTIDYLGC